MARVILKLQPERVPLHKLASIHREMSEMEYNALKLSIEENGQLVPIILYRNKLVDGRHRQRALIDLGIHDMDCIELPNNLSLNEVKERVMGTEMRRGDNVAQKAIRGFKWYMDNADNATQVAAATKFGVGSADISRAKKLYDKIGSEEVNKLYKQGYLYYNGKRYTTLQSILKLHNTGEKDQVEREPLSDEAEAVKDILHSMLVKGDIAGIAYSEAVAKDLRMKDV